ncbi:hypothetical protein [Flavobacterium coralii]|uniref:hypothetical protein n=1 Tax=Flavobacterium coralii TaxID=2838017 RepID=UPI000C5B6F87|nr:hypothetical protein [Flavobacterium sp.]|tara:strand:- start:6027 stop:6590 length:564 start_codon:yes stop_codon:yes gene_type:complete
MKNYLLKTTAFFAVALTATGCSNDATVSDMYMNNSTSVLSDEQVAEDMNRAYYWQSEIGEEVNGEYIITADVNLLKADLEAVLANEGRPTTLQDVFITGMIADNDPTDKGFFLIGSDKNGQTISLQLEKVDTKFILYSDNGFVKTVSCDGCVSGCNLSYLLINGKRVAYCQENGCSEYDCSKSESSF